MSFINLDLLKNSNALWSQTKKLTSALDKNDKKPYYIFPHDIDKKEQSTYMVIYIYDQDGNINFKPAQLNNVNTSIIDELRNNISSIVKINVDDQYKKSLKKYQDAIYKSLKDKLKGGDFLPDSLKDSFKGIKDTAKSIQSWIDDSLSAINDTVGSWVDSLAESINLPKPGNILPSDLIPKVSISVDKKQIKNIINKKKSELKNKYSSMEKAEEEKYNVSLKGSICLGLPKSDIKQSLDTNINQSELFQSRNLMAVLQSMQKDFNTQEGWLSAVAEGVAAGLKTTTDLVKVYGKEMLYDMLGEGGKGLYQHDTQRIRDPLIYFTYSLPKARTYTFDYIFAPKDHDELMDITNIIKMLKYCAAPGISSAKSKVQYASSEYSSGKDSAYFTTPSKFRIKFYTNSVENIWYGKTKLLGLTGIETTIPQGTSFIIDDDSSLNGNAPRLIGLTLTFTELTIVDRNDINEGY